MNDDLLKGFEEISKHYTMAREILDLSGVVSPDGKTITYQSGRIKIYASTQRMLLKIDFDDRANTGKDYWNNALNVSSLGTIQHLGQPHLSESEAKEGRSKYRHIKWYTFLMREHKKVTQAVAA